eukprot:scaffold1810_cov60-Cyclotella_meneghiniana.AAC.12
MATVGKTEDLKNDRTWGRERLRESRFSRLYRPEISLNVKNTMQQPSKYFGEWGDNFRCVVCISK